METRINKYLSEVGFVREEKPINFGTRKNYHQWQKPELGTKVSDADEICVDGKTSKTKKKTRLYRL